MKFLSYLSAAALTLSGLSASAQAQKPIVEKPIAGSEVILNGMSNNGKWAVAQSGSTTDGDLRPVGGVIFNMENFEQTPISHPSGLSGVSDITDDGSIVVGECNTKPGYWSKSTGEWTSLETPQKNGTGRFNAVTPDGHFAVGYCNPQDNQWKAYPIVYDLQAKKYVELTNLPKLDMSHLDQGQNVFFSISPDGRYALGQMSMSYMMPVALCSYVYDLQTQTYDFIGFTPDDEKPWTPKVPGLYFVDGPAMSNNGEWVTGFAYMVYEIPGSEWANETYCSFRYNVLTKDFEVFDNSIDYDIAGFSIGNDGTVYGATPAQNPYASTMVRSGKYFVSLDQIFKQVYNYDYNDQTGYAVTGKVVSLSDDGKTLVMLPNTDGVYVLRLPESLAEAAKRVKLLGNYSVTPTEGVKLSRLSTISLTFDRNIKFTGTPSKITFAGGSDSFSPVAVNGVVAEGRKLTLTFRTRDLKEGVEYTLNIPAGDICIDGDESIKADEINVKYTGRANVPVKMLSVAPQEDSYVTTLDANNPIIMQFDADLLPTGATGQLYRNDEETAFCTLNLGVIGSRGVAVPTAGQMLMDGSEYHIVIPAGAFTDISGGGANEEITFSYKGKGQFVPNPSDRYLYENDCTDYNQMMYYDGDNRQPDVVPESWGFTKDSTPWFIVRDEESRDMAMASHSMYKPAGKADDWMMTPQLMIADENCYLEFDAQSYLSSCNDVLDVYIYKCGNVYNTLTGSIVKDVLAKADHPFHEQLKPGKSEEELEGDWTHYEIDLKEYAGETIYIAFANQNDDQSAIFVDNIHVVHNMPYYLTFETPQRVVNVDDVQIKGYILFDDDQLVYKSISLTPFHAEGTQVDKIDKNGLELKKGSKFDFAFSKNLPVAKGESTTYYVEISLDGDKPARLTGNISNLSFQPSRRIVLEEYTGSECGNCPLGIRGMENIESLYPDVMIPITIRTYQNDRLGSGMGAYSQYLGLDNMGAPSAIIDRKEAGYPMIQSADGDYRFTGTGIPNETTGNDERCWLDIFRTQYETPAEVGIGFDNKYDETTRMIDVRAEVTSALNQYRATYNIFAAITEDGLITYQKNYMTGVEDPDLGEWGKGGKYGTPVVSNVEAHGVARQTWGTTFNGTSGLIPPVMQAGRTYVANFQIPLPETVSDPANCNVILMLIDAGTGYVVNANTCKLNSFTNAVENITADSSAIGMTVIDGNLYVNAAGKYSVAAYDMAGAMILSAAAEETTALPLNGYNGVLLVKVVDENGNARSAKFMIK